METIDFVEKIIQEAINSGAFPSANYAIVTKERLYLNSLGNKCIYEKTEPNCLNTLYDLASLSKVIVTTTCLFKLLEKGMLRLFAPVSNYLPRFKHENVTVWHLMTHTSGLPAGLSGLLELNSATEIYNKIYDLPLLFEPGLQICYSDIGYVLLGQIIESITKCKLDDFAKEVLFDPLEMFDTTYNPKDINKSAATELRDNKIKKGLTRGVVHDEMAYLLGGVAGHAGVFASIFDMAKFAQMILNDGKYHDKEILSKASIDLMYKPCVKMHKPAEIDGTIRSLGWLVGGNGGIKGDFASANTIYHTGFTGTAIWIDRTNEIAFCILTNRVHPSRNTHLHLDAFARVANYIMANRSKF